jgi:hypothetical protein
LRRLQPPLREASRDLVNSISGTANNAYAHLLRRAETYQSYISLSLEEIDFALLYAAGLRLENAKAAAERDIDGLISPALEDNQFEALKSVVTLHGIFISSSAEGQDLLTDAERIDMTHEDVAATTRDIIEILEPLTGEVDLVDAEASQAIIEVASDNAPVRHPERRVAYTYSAASNLLIVLGGYAILGVIAGGSLAGAAELTTGVALHSGLTGRGKDARYFATILISDTADFADHHLQTLLRKGATAAKSFILRHEGPLRRLATRSRRFNFLNDILDWLAEKT